MLPQAIGPLLGYLCVQVSTSASHSGESFTLNFGVGAPSGRAPFTWSGVPEGPLQPGSPPPAVTFSYVSSSYNSSEDALHLSSINGTLNHSVTGTITGSGSTLQLAIAITTYMEINQHILGSDAASSSANIVERNWSVSYDLVVSEGEREANPVNQAETNTGGDLNYNMFEDLFLGSGGLASMVAAIRGQIPDLSPGYQYDLQSAIQQAMEMDYGASAGVKRL